MENQRTLKRCWWVSVPVSQLPCGIWRSIST